MERVAYLAGLIVLALALTLLVLAVVVTR